MGESLSVVIPVRDMAALLPVQLDALRQQSHLDFEVVVVDNGSRDDLKSVIDEWATRLPNLRAVPDQRIGISIARNRGLREATNDLVLYCDADDRVGPGWVEAMARALQQYDIVAGARMIGRGDGLHAPATPAPTSLPSFLDFLPFADGCGAGYRRSAVESVGGWDEVYFGGYGCVDVDLCWRMQLAGYTLGYAREAIVYKRERRALADSWRQSWSWGVRHAMLFRRFQRHGMPRAGGPSSLWRLVRKLPRLRSSIGRRKWLNRLATTGGRFAGSLRYGTWYV